jgi:hypothetical protein
LDCRSSPDSFFQIVRAVEKAREGDVGWFVNVRREIYLSTKSGGAAVPPIGEVVNNRKSNYIRVSRRRLMIGVALPFDAMISDGFTVFGLADVLRLVCDTAAVRELLAAG